MAESTTSGSGSCPHCGSPISDSDAFCPTCGKPVFSSDTPAQDEPKATSSSGYSDQPYGNGPQAFDAMYDDYDMWSSNEPEEPKQPEPEPEPEPEPQPKPSPAAEPKPADSPKPPAPAPTTTGSNPPTGSKSRGKGGIVIAIIVAVVIAIIGGIVFAMNSGSSDTGVQYYVYEGTDPNGVRTVREIEVDQNNKVVNVYQWDSQDGYSDPIGPNTYSVVTQDNGTKKFIINDVTVGDREVYFIQDPNSQSRNLQAYYADDDSNANMTFERSATGAREFHGQ